MTAGGSTYMPLRVNMAGVIPIIFAAAIMAFPPTIAQYFPQTQDFVNAHFTPSNLTLPAVRGLPDHHLHVLLHRGPVQPGRPGRPAPQARRLHPGDPARPADRPVPRPRPDAAHAARRALPRDRRHPAEHLHPLRRLLAGELARARRHLRADRGRRRARHDAPDGVADDDALLRGLPEVGGYAARRPAPGRPGVRQGNAGEADRLGLRARAHRRPGDMLRAAIADGTALGRRVRAHPRAAASSSPTT